MFTISDALDSLGYALLRDYNRSGKPSRGKTYSFTEAMVTEPSKCADVDYAHSVNAGWDKERTFAFAKRNLGGSIKESPFNDAMWPSWTPVRPDSSQAFIHTGADNDPNITSWLDMHTVGDPPGPSRMAGAQMNMGYVPETFGVATIVRLDQVGTHIEDAQEHCIQTSSGRVVGVRFTDMGVYVFSDGAWRKIAYWGGNWWTEWWIQVSYVGDNKHCVQLYAGTQKMPWSYTGVLPIGANSNNNGLYTVLQLSGASNWRHSRCAVVNIGLTQLAQAMSMVLQPVAAATSPTCGKVMILVEDPGQVLPEPESLVNAYIAKSTDPFSTPSDWAEVPLDIVGTFEWGEMDDAKTMVWLAGEAPFSVGSGTTIRVNVTTAENELFPIQGVVVRWE